MKGKCVRFLVVAGVALVMALGLQQGVDAQRYSTQYKSGINDPQELPKEYKTDRSTLLEIKDRQAEILNLLKELKEEIADLNEKIGDGS